LFGGAAICAYVWFARPNVPVDRSELEREAFLRQVVLFHSGAGPCLRYAAEPSSQEVVLAAQELVAVPLTTDEARALVVQFWNMARERELSHHDRSEADEAVEIIMRGAVRKFWGPLAPVVAGTIYRSRLKRTHDTVEAATAVVEDKLPEAKKAWDSLGAARQLAVRSVFERHSGALMLNGIVSVLKAMKTEETNVRLKALAVALRDYRKNTHAWPMSLSQLALASAFLKDGWGYELALHAFVSDREATISSEGPRNSWDTSPYYPTTGLKVTVVAEDVTDEASAQ